MEINADDINAVEQQFGIKFNDEQIGFIKNYESLDLQACPGSGKTTTLAAKLLLLREKLPANNNSGIAVITHTNVAVEEIKKKLSLRTKDFTSYPNHLGTIQSFIDKYITIPAYRYYKKKALYSIDDEDYYRRAEQLSNTRHYRDAMYYFSRRGFEIQNARFCYKTLDVSKDINGTPLGIAATTNSAMQLKAYKEQLFDEGYLCFDDAYSLAYRYLRDFPKVEHAIRQRFQHVFVDEMQDMQAHQFDIIQKLFDVPQVLLQKVGDINQAIYSQNSGIEEEYWTPNVKLELNRSVRFSKTIAKKVENLGVHPQELHGWEGEPQIAPKVIAFDDSTIHLVKDKFGELIINHGLVGHGNGVFKAVGFRKEATSTGRGISSYLESFDKQTLTSNKPYFDNIQGYIQQVSNTSATTPGKLRQTLLNVLARTMTHASVQDAWGKPFTAKRLERHLKEVYSKDYALLCANLSRWVLEIRRGNFPLDELKAYVLSLLSIFTVDSDFVEEFFTPEQQASSDTGSTVKSNRYTFSKNEASVDIEFNTIHGVKGETHCATLFLETFYRTYDIKKITPFLIGKHKARDVKQNLGRLRTSYVAVTRPSHMLCLAIHKEHLTGLETELTACGWDLIDITT